MVVTFLPLLLITQRTRYSSILSKTPAYSSYKINSKTRYSCDLCLLFLKYTHLPKNIVVHSSRCHPANYWCVAFVCRGLSFMIFEYHVRRILISVKFNRLLHENNILIKWSNYAFNKRGQLSFSNCKCKWLPTYAPVTNKKI